MHLELSGAGKRYGEAWALQPTNHTFKPQGTTALIGPSGCGKSTLLRLLVGLIEPEAGQILVDGESLTEARHLSVRRRVGYVIQGGGLFPHLTGAQNVALLAEHLGRERGWIEQRLTELCALVQLDRATVDRPPGQLSGGQRQRVALMRALMLDPEVILLDEPLGALDPLIRAELQRDLKAIFARLKRTVILVTHDLAEAAWFADEIVLMRAGEVVQVGPLEALVDTPADPFVTRFIHAQRQALGLEPPA